MTFSFVFRGLEDTKNEFLYIDNVHVPILYNIIYEYIIYVGTCNVLSTNKRLKGKIVNIFTFYTHLHNLFYNLHYILDNFKCYVRQTLVNT